ncbi:receptor-like protein kinase 4 [Artemisia annua]|nr:receptor-like protein kinase 4 [Artemisia annua]
MEEVVRVGLVAVWCIQDEEVSRPTMGMVVKMLEGVVEVEVPPPPKLLQALVSGESFHGVGGNSRNDTLSHVSVDSKDSQFAI